MSFLRPSAAHRLKQLHHTPQQQQIKTVLEYLGSGNCWCRSKKLSRNCLTAMFYLISSENLVTFDAVSAAQFSFSLRARVGCGLSKKKEKEGTRKRSHTFLLFSFALGQTNVPMYELVLCAQPGRERPFGLYTRIEMGEYCPIPPSPISNFDKIHDCAIIGQATQVRGMSH